MIKSLTGIRFWLFLSILVNHFYTNIIIKSEMGYSGYSLFIGPFAVLFFFVLSGFCIAINNLDKFTNISFDSIKTFMIKKIVKFYPLYFLTGLIILIFHYIPLSYKWIYAFIFLYIPMLQPYTPWHSGGGNATAWFLAALILCYLITPFVLCFMYNHFKNLKGKLIAYSILYLVLIILAISILNANLSDKLFDQLHHFPPLRVFHYLAGLIIGAIYSMHLKTYLEKSISFIKKSFLDIIVIILCLFVCALEVKAGGVPHVHGKYIPIENIIGVPVVSIVILYLCNTSKSILSYILENKIVLYLGSISFECWLIHYVYIVFLKKPLIPYCHNYFDVFVITLSLLLITITTALLYKFLYGKAMELMNKKRLKT